MQECSAPCLLRCAVSAPVPRKVFLAVQVQQAGFASLGPLPTLTAAVVRALSSLHSGSPTSGGSFCTDPDAAHWTVPAVPPPPKKPPLLQVLRSQGGTANLMK